jgi:hypothetical protein
MDLQRLLVEVNVIDALLMALRVHGELGLTAALFVRAIKRVRDGQWLFNGTLEISCKVHIIRRWHYVKIVSEKRVSAPISRTGSKYTSHPINLPSTSSASLVSTFPLFKNR